MMQGNDIIIIEDDAVIAMDVKKICESLGYKCLCIDNERYRLDIVRLMNPVLILIDLKLDGAEDLFPEADKICDEFNFPVIFFTTAPPENYKNNPIQRKCIFRSFPFSAEELKRSISILLENYGPSHRN
ncbi:MAG TPA: hypothetical protein VMT35_10090 [Ignavibacteriaceae bacterium]|nr:hypothetical protein [Ignavibacteriaceae bacterium]